MKAKHFKRQKTFTYGDIRITFIARRITRLANFVGYRVKVLIDNVEKYDWFCQKLTTQEAFDFAAVKLAPIIEKGINW